MTIAADPRLRARKVAVAREAGHRRLVALSAGLTAVALLVTALVLLHSSLLSAKVVHLRGAVHESRAEVLAVTGLSAHPPLADLSTGAAAAALERLPWVASARVVDDWPTGVTVAITERRPVAYVPLVGGQATLLDVNGRVLATGVPRPAGLVALSVVGGVGPPGSTDAADFPALQVAADLPPSLAARVASVAHGPDGVQLQLVKGPVVVLGDATGLTAKLTALSTLLAKVPLHAIVTIDLRVPAQPVLTR